MRNQILFRFVGLLPGPAVRFLYGLYWRGRLPRPLMAWTTRLMRHRVVTIGRGVGVGLRFDAADANIGYALGISEPDVQEALAARLGPGMVFYDIGANVGFFTVLGARLVGPTGQVYAFEPLPENAAALRANVALNGFANVTVIERAAAAAPGTGRLRLADHPTLATLRANADDSSGRTAEVGLVAVDDLVRSGEIAPPDLVKMDVEGAEIDALRGMVETIRAHRPIVVCEMHDTNREFGALMRGLEYDVQTLGTSVAIESAAADAHAVATPR